MILILFFDSLEKFEMRQNGPFSWAKPHMENLFNDAVIEGLWVKIAIVQKMDIINLTGENLKFSPRIIKSFSNYTIFETLKNKNTGF